jgi:hypothetical protein
MEVSYSQQAKVKNELINPSYSLKYVVRIEGLVTLPFQLITSLPKATTRTSIQQLNPSLIFFLFSFPLIPTRLYDRNCRFRLGSYRKVSVTSFIEVESWQFFRRHFFEEIVGLGNPNFELPLKGSDALLGSSA